MTKLIIVCGFPGSGKTTLAREISKKLKICCIYKDSIKEKLYETLELSTLEDSVKIGKPAVEIMLHLAEQQLANNVDIMIESPFYFEEDFLLFEKWKDTYNIDIYSIICSIDEAEREKRLHIRPRHHAHHDNERKFDALSKERLDVYKKIPGNQIWVKTNKPADELVAEIISKIKKDSSR